MPEHVGKNLERSGPESATKNVCPISSPGLYKSATIGCLAGFKESQTLIHILMLTIGKQLKEAEEKNEEK